MHGLMMDMPLLISDLIRHADRHHGDTEIVSKTVEDGSIHRYSYREAHRRSRRLARALAALGVQPGDRVATSGLGRLADGTRVVVRADAADAPEIPAAGGPEVAPGTAQPGGDAGGEDRAS